MGVQGVASSHQTIQRHVSVVYFSHRVTLRIAQLKEESLL